MLKASPGGAQHLAHAALTDHWCPKYSSEVAKTLQAFGLKFAGSTSFEMNDLELSLPAALRSEIQEALGVSQLEMFKDFYHYTQQRKDVFVRTTSAASPDEALLSSKTYMDFLWPGGAVCVDDIAAKLKAEGHGAADISKTLKRMLTVNDLDVFSSPPTRRAAAGLAEVRAGNRYNEIAVQRLVASGGELFPSCRHTGGCVSLPALVSTIAAAFVGNKVADVTVDKAVAFVRQVPGSCMTGQGKALSGSQVTPQMIAPAHDLVVKMVLPLLIELGALDAA